MAQKGNFTPPVFNFPAMLELGQKQVNAFAEMQKGFCASLEMASRDWLARAERERNLANECTTKIFSAKTIPEAASVCQDWIGRHMTTMAEDNQKLAAESQKFMSSASKLWNGGVST